MGSLAMWGAVAGGAEGVSGEITRRQEAEATAEAARIDQAREERMMKLRQAHEEKMAGRREEHEKSLETQRQGGREALAEMDYEKALDVETIRNVYAGERQGAKIESDESEGALDRSSRERIARIQAAGSSAGARRALSRYEARVLTVSEAQEYGLPIEKDTPAVFDKLGAQWYVQEGDKLRFPGEEEKAIRANPRAVQALYAAPERAAEFYQKYKYLPIDYLGVINEAAAGLYAEQQPSP